MAMLIAMTTPIITTMGTMTIIMSMMAITTIIMGTITMSTITARKACTTMVQGLPGRAFRA